MKKKIIIPLLSFLTIGLLMGCGEKKCEHTFDEWKVSETEHWHECTKCGEKVDVNKHNGGSADCTNKAKCGICGVYYGALNPDKHNDTNNDGKCEGCQNIINSLPIGDGQKHNYKVKANSVFYLKVTLMLGDYRYDSDNCYENISFHILNNGEEFDHFDTEHISRYDFVVLENNVSENNCIMIKNQNDTDVDVSFEIHKHNINVMGDCDYSGCGYLGIYGKLKESYNIKFNSAGRFYFFINMKPGTYYIGMYQKGEEYAPTSIKVYNFNNETEIPFEEVGGLISFSLTSSCGVTIVVEDTNRPNDVYIIVVKDEYQELYNGITKNYKESEVEEFAFKVPNSGVYAVSYSGNTQIFSNKKEIYLDVSKNYYNFDKSVINSIAIQSLEEQEVTIGLESIDSHNEVGTSEGFVRHYAGDQTYEFSSNINETGWYKVVTNKTELAVSILNPSDDPKLKTDDNYPIYYLDKEDAFLFRVYSSTALQDASVKLVKIDDVTNSVLSNEGYTNKYSVGTYTYLQFVAGDTGYYVIETGPCIEVAVYGEFKKVEYSYFFKDGERYLLKVYCSSSETETIKIVPCDN